MAPGGAEMSLPYFPMYPTDFEADTSHLTLAEDGAYNRLLRLCWMTPGCSLPDDDVWIFRRMRAHSDDDKTAILNVVGEFFTRKSGRVFSARLQREALLADEAHKKRVLAGQKGGRSAKALKTNETIQSNAKAKPKQPEPEPILKGDTNVSPKNKRGSRLPDGWVLPADWGQWAISEGWAETTIRAEAERFRDYWISLPGQRGVKLDWLAVWRNWMRKAPKLSPINGGHHDKPSNKSDRLQRVVTAAASGTSRKDWG